MADPLDLGSVATDASRRADPPPFGTLVDRARDRSRRRVLAVGATVLVAVVGIGLAVLRPGFGPPAPVGPTHTTLVPHTRFVKVDPFDSAGALRPGYTVDDATRAGGLRCTGPSPVAVTGGTSTCGPTAANAFACWQDPSHRSQVLCLANPWSTTVYRWRATHAGYTTAPAQPRPFAVQLVDGSRWWYREGGAWGTTPEGTSGIYGCQPHSSCDHPGTSLALLAPDTGPAFDTAKPLWTALVGEMGPVASTLPAPRRVAVATIWYVASAQP